MNEDRSFVSEGIWVGLCLLLLLVLAGAGASWYFQFQRARAAAEAEIVMRREAEAQAESRHAATERAADLSAKLRDLESRVGELDSENHNLRQQLEGQSR